MAELLDRVVRVAAFFRGCRKPSVGTGFRIGPRRTLTAQHVVDRKDKVRVGLKVWSPQPGETSKANDPSSWPNAVTKPLWMGELAGAAKDSDEACDVAVIEDCLEPDVELFPEILRHRSPKGNFIGWGFPPGSGAEAFLLKGDIGDFRSGAKTVQVLNHFSDAPEAGEGKKPWRGISGGPVFLEAGGDPTQLFGIFLDDWKGVGERLRVFMLPSLPDDSPFWKKIGLPEPDEVCFEWLNRWAKKHLEQGMLPVLCARELGEPQKVPVDAVTWKLLDEDRDSALRQLCETRRPWTLLNTVELLSRDSQKPRQKALATLASDLVAALCAAEAGVCEEEGELVVRTVDEKVVALGRAAAIGRSVRFILHQGELIPDSFFRWPTLEAASNVDRAVSDLGRELVLQSFKRDVEEGGRLVRQSDLDIVGKLIKHGEVKSKEELNWLGKVIDQRLAKRPDRAFTFAPPANSLNGESRQAFLEVLGGLLDGLDVLTCKPDRDAVIAFYGEIEPLWKILDEYHKG